MHHLEQVIQTERKLGSARSGISKHRYKERDGNVCNIQKMIVTGAPTLPNIKLAI